MGGLHKTAKKVIPKEMRSPLDKKIGEENIKTHESLNRRMNPEMPTAGDEKVIPLADEEELERQRRRKSRGGGRASTVLTSDDEGLGG
jgi:hypothetical protein